MSKKVLITGGNGQLGLSLYFTIKNIFNTTRTSKKKTKDSIKLDISCPDNVEKCLNKVNPDIIINCASYNGVDQAELDRKNARDVIVGGLSNLVKYSNIDTKIIHISSDYLYNGDKGTYSEKDIPNPINYYGKLKHEAENLLISSKKKCAILRCNVVFSHYIDNKSNFLGWVYSNLKKGNKINVVTDQISNPTPVELVCDVIQSIILLNRYSIYNIGTLESVSRFEFAYKISEIFNLNSELIKSVETKFLNQKAKRPMNTFLKFDKLVEELGIEVFSSDYYLKRIMKKINE